MRIFENNEFGKVRTIVIDEEPLLVAKDIVEKLGYDLSGKHVASEYIKSHCDEEDYIFVDKNSPLKYGSVINYKDLGQRGGYLINESGVYALILGSELPSAKRFKRWITKEVIPQIRKTGGYIPIKEEDTNETIMAKAYLIATETLAKQKELVNKLQPLADVAETRIEKKGCLSLTDVTKSLGFKRGQITRWAKAQGYLHLTLTEVNKVGEKYFKVYSSDQIHNQIGITEEGLQLIRDNKETIMKLTVKKAS